MYQQVVGGVAADSGSSSTREGPRSDGVTSALDQPKSKHRLNAILLGTGFAVLLGAIVFFILIMIVICITTIANEFNDNTITTLSIFDNVVIVSIC